MALARLRIVQHRKLPIIERLAKDPWRRGPLPEHNPPRKLMRTSASFRRFRPTPHVCSVVALRHAQHRLLLGIAVGRMGREVLNRQDISGRPIECLLHVREFIVDRNVHGNRII